MYSTDLIYLLKHSAYDIGPFYGKIMRKCLYFSATISHRPRSMSILKKKKYDKESKYLPYYIILILNLYYDITGYMQSIFFNNSQTEAYLENYIIIICKYNISSVNRIHKPSIFPRIRI